uniref:Predicted protein n=1 Tax=Hordeum vulgare subsp. vulgare TaxID=112509 RepID=F2DF60_HORVV|nr:predicted protein [Hordeum vulgare subsp. vulgare]
MIDFFLRINKYDRLLCLFMCFSIQQSKRVLRKLASTPISCEESYVFCNHMFYTSKLARFLSSSYPYVLNPAIQGVLWAFTSTPTTWEECYIFSCA